MMSPSLSWATEANLAYQAGMVHRRQSYRVMEALVELVRILTDSAVLRLENRCQQVNLGIK